MLVLSRRQGEAIQIGDFTVVVHRIGENRVKLEIKAPPEVPIRRGELEPIQKATTNGSGTK